MEDSQTLGLPQQFGLAQNYPNPFNPETTIQYQLPQTGNVTLRIYNLLGQEVRTLVSENQTAGSYSVAWNGKNDVGEFVTSGMYFYKLKVGESFLVTRKMLFLK
ncbi:MAG: T9SS type A sorting domain-containing protein [bacterium]